ncbi:MAG TPA: glycosyltransferase [Terriglobales bacterium]|nr:glycosyltransferase [Terriglobales bacterium]
MALIFWLAAILLVYTFAGYALLAWLRSRWRPRPVRRQAGFEPSISIVLAVRNEEKVMAAKLANLAALDYPARLREVIVVSDGSSDATDAILAAHAAAPGGERVRFFPLPQAGGKAVALNRGLAAARGEVVVFTDARQRIAPEAVRRLVENFADPEVGAVSGELELGGGSGLGLYWRIEKKIRQWESAAGSSVGATGALYAVRRGALRPLPAGTILDDVFTPMQVVRQGLRVVFEPAALAYDQLGAPRHEFRRKVRTLSGNYQLLQLAPWILTRANPVRLAFVSHKLLRLLAPFALAALLLSSLLLTGPLYRLALLLQLAFYGLAVVGGFRRRLWGLRRLADPAHAFVLLNTAAALAFFNWVSGKQTAWPR